MKLGFTYLLLSLLLLLHNPLFAQDRLVHEVDGRPFNTHRFVDQVADASNENWATVQHPNGLVYVANQNGVLEFDGHTWRLIELPDKNSVFSLGIDSDGVVFVGARGDLGRLVSNAAGVLQFESMLDYIDPKQRDFLNVWGVHANSKNVVFQANQYLFIWDGTQMTSIESNNRLHTSFGLFDRTFVKKDGVGLLELVGDSLQMVAEGESFADKRVFMMEPRQDGSIMIGAQQGIEGPLLLYSLSESGLRPFVTDPHFLDLGERHTYYAGARMRDTYFAVASIYDGVFIVNENGQLVESLGADRSIPEDVTSVYKDQQGGLWITHYTNGITHIGAPFSLSEYDLPGNLVNDVVRFQEKLYIATDEGLFTLADRREVNDLDLATQYDTVDVEPITNMRFSLLPFENQLLVATQTGVYSLVDETSSRVAFNYKDKPRSLIASEKYPGRVYVGMESGLGMMTHTKEGWQWQKLDSLKKPITSLAEHPDGSFWFSRKTTLSQVWKMQFNEQGEKIDEVFVVDENDFDEGNAGVGELEVEIIGGEMSVTAVGKGIFRVKEDTSAGFGFMLYPDSLLNGPGAASDSLKYAFSADEKNFWTVYPNRLVLNTIEENGEVTRNEPQVLQFSNLSRVDHVHVDSDKVIWLGDKNRLLKFKPEYAHLDQTSLTFGPMIRSVSLAWVDSVLYAGGYEGSQISDPDNLAILTHEDNDLAFEFAVPDFFRLGAIEYSYKIDGMEPRWSEWTPDNRVVYRNLNHGSHELLVRARSGDTYYNKTASLPFTIRPPWYATWWMRLAYGGLALLGLFFAFRYSHTRKQLELLEKERLWFDRIRLANEQLRSANSSLEEANRMKDEFLANASHELRTPLTAILGFTSVLKEELLDEHQEFAGLIDENGQRLLKTINSLLDLAKLRAGTVQLNLRPIEVNTIVEKMVGFLMQLAKNQSIELRISKSQKQIFAILDEDSFERVLYNLIGNAIKFTPEGSVDVEVTHEQKQVAIHIRDTGIGIEESFIPFLFDEFKQEPSVEVHSDGSGLGLAISSKLVDMMGGRIDVVSQKGVGSTFTVTFPIDYIEYKGSDTKTSERASPEAPTESTM